MIKVACFDLDGTLLKMDYHQFAKIYLPSLYAYVKKHINIDVDFKDFSHGLVKAIEDVVKNDDENCSYDKFYYELHKYFRFDELEMKKVVSNYYYSYQFDECEKVCSPNEALLEVINLLKEKDVKLVVATNPFFPREAILARLRWAKVDPSDFIFITYGDIFHNLKPNLSYYQEVKDKIDEVLQQKISFQEILMIGNDVEEDMVASKLGYQTYLVNDCLISRFGNENNISHRGSSNDLLKEIKENENN